MFVFGVGSVAGLASAFVAYVGRTLRLERPALLGWRRPLRWVAIITAIIGAICFLTGVNMVRHAAVPSAGIPQTESPAGKPATAPSPSAETPAPSAETPPPSAETSPPSAESPPPSPAPSAQTPPPSAEAPAPSTETPQPSAETPAPSAETPAPSEETGKSEGEGPFPSQPQPVYPEGPTRGQ